MQHERHRWRFKDVASAMLGAVVGVAVGYAARDWLKYLPTSVALFALVPFVASLPARKEARGVVSALTSLAMLVTFFWRGWLLSAGNGSRERLAEALPLLIVIYGAVAVVGWLVTRGMRIALTAATRRAA